MIEYSYDEIINHFDKNEWDFSYLTYQEIIEVLNFPIKLYNSISNVTVNGLPFSEDVFFLVCIKRTKNFDYTFLTQFLRTIKEEIPDLICEKFWCNYKYAAVKAGLGQYAKNSLFYHPVFQFETHIGVFLIQNKVINLPERNVANFNLLSLCNNCNDCINACPVGAIHNNGNHTWIDMEKCDNFCHFGNHVDIPSIKWNWFILDDGMIPLFKDYRDIFMIQSYADLKKVSNNLNSHIIKINNESYQVVFPICRECTSRKRCSKYNGEYPYDWSTISIIKEE